jgi:hypothetical protein
MTGEALTIVSSKEIYFKGFMVKMTSQIGCATTGDYPSEETENAVEKYHTEQLDLCKGLLLPAYKHFIEGDHPFIRFRKTLDSEKVLEENDIGYVPQDMVYSTPRSDPIYIRGYEVYLFMKEGVDDILRNKVCYDFMLSQAFVLGTEIFSPYTDKQSEDFFQQGLLQHVSGTFPSILWRFEFFLGYAITHPDELEALATMEISDDQDPRIIQQERTRRLRARALKRVFASNPYGQELIDEAKELGTGNSELQYLLLMSSDINAKEVLEILERIDNLGLRDFLRPLEG